MNSISKKKKKKAQCFSDKCTPKPRTPLQSGAAGLGRWALVPGSGLEASGREGELSVGAESAAPGWGRGGGEGRLLRGAQRGQCGHRPRRGPCSCCVGRHRAWWTVLPSPAPSVPSLTLSLADVPPASHPAVIPVLELQGGGRDADGLDVLIEGNRGGELHQGDVMLKILPELGECDNILDSISTQEGPQAPNGWCGR